jgi:anti-sigma-K factor RskA
MSNSPDAEWWLHEAGEYVLGTLRGSERDLFERVLERDADARSMVYFWESHLAALDSMLARDDAHTAPIPAHVWQSIKRRLDEAPPSRDDGSTLYTGAMSGLPGAAVSGGRGATDRSDLWRFAAGISMAASIALGALVLNQLRLAPVPLSAGTDTGIAAVDAPDVVGGEVGDELDIVAVLSGEDGTQLWLVVADETDGSLRAIALQTPAQTDTQSHQLWVVLPDDGGVESVGLLPYGDGSSTTFALSTASAQQRLRAGAAFAISLEPAGGTDSAAPTGPVISSSAFTRIADDSF